MYESASEWLQEKRWRMVILLCFNLDARVGGVR